MSRPGVIILLGVSLWCAGVVEAKTENGLTVVVQKTVLDAGKDRNAFLDWNKVTRALGLKLEMKNTSFKDMPEGVLTYVVIVKKWGGDGNLEKYAGSEKVPALLRSQSITEVVGKVPLSGYQTGGNRNEFMDSIEAYQVIISHGGKQTIEVTSSSSFEALSKKARKVESRGDK